MLWIDYTLLALLDVFPWIIFQIGPFHNNTKLGHRKTLTLIAVVAVIGKLIISFLNFHMHLSQLESFFLHNVSNFVTIGLALLLIDTNKFKILFICLLTVPGSAVTVTISSYVADTFFDPSHAIFAMLITRLLATLALGAIYHQFWKKYFTLSIPYVIQRENELWRYAWRIPAFLVLISIAVYTLEVMEDYISLFDVILQTLLCVCVLFICALFFDCLKYARANISKRTDTEKMEALLTLQQKHSKELLADFNRIKKNNHDFRHHLATLATYAKEKEYGAITTYIESLVNTTCEYQQKFFCENIALNALIVSNNQKAQENHIDMELKISIPEGIAIADIDLSVLFGNILENAIEASLFLPEAERKIKVKSRLYGNKLYLIVQNHYLVERLKPDIPYHSSKRNYERVGIGLFTVENIVHKYDGELDIAYDNGIFSVKIILEIPKE